MSVGFDTEPGTRVRHESYGIGTVRKPPNPWAHPFDKESAAVVVNFDDPVVETPFERRHLLDVSNITLDPVEGAAEASD